MKPQGKALYVAHAKGRRQLTIADLKAAENLKRIWQREQALKKFTATAAALRLGWKTAGAIYPYLNGKIPLSIAVTLRFARFLGVHPYEIRPNVDIPYSLVSEPDAHKGDGNPYSDVGSDAPAKSAGGQEPEAS